MKQPVNRRWHVYLICEHLENMYKKRSLRIKPDALLLSAEAGTSKKRWELARKKEKLIRVWKKQYEPLNNTVFPGKSGSSTWLRKMKTPYFRNLS